MSNLLSQASLVMIPSGYKEDVVYSPIPTNGNGDLSFTRASNGTRINSAGLVEVTPWNLLQYSEDFSNAYWNKYQASITSNTTTAPNGTATADTLVSGSGFAGVVYTSSIFSAGDILTLSIYAKANTSSILQLGTTDGTDRSANFNLSTGVVVSSVGVTASIESVGNGWYRCSVSRTMLNPANFFVVEGTGSLSLFIWGAQTNVGVSAKPYFPTTDRLNVPRLTYQNGGGGCPSLLLEKQSTNLVTYSEQFDNAGWLQQGGATITANQAVSPDGTQNADKLNVDIQAYSYAYQTISATTAIYTESIFAKKGTKNWLFILNTTGGGARGWFNVNTGVVGTIASGYTGTITDVGNGWYRCTLTNTTSEYGNYVGFGFVDADNTVTPTSTGYGYLWGAQLEVSSYPTSYIPTTSATATRVADACFKTGISSLIGQTEGVIFYDGVLTGISNPYANLINSEKNTTGSFSIGHSSTGVMLATLFVNSNAIVNFNVGSFAVGTRTKIAFAYKSGSFALYVNGTQLATSAATFTPIENMDDIYIGDVTTYFNYKENTQVNQVALFTTRLTNAELASLTTI